MTSCPEKNSGMGAARKAGWAPGPRAGGAEGRGRVDGVFKKVSNPHPRPGSRLQRCPHGAQPYICFSRKMRTHAYPSGRAGAGLLCPDSAGYNPACPSRVPKGRAQNGYLNATAGLGLSHTSAFPAQGMPMPTPKRKAGAAVSRQRGL